MNTKQPDPNCPLCFGKGMMQRTDMLEPWACECCEEKPATPQPEQKSETPELKPCPFCRGTRIIKGERYFAMCVDCGATGPERIGDKAGIKKLFADWNTRDERELNAARSEVEKLAGQLSQTVQAQIEASALASDWQQKHTELFFESDQEEIRLMKERDTLREQLEVAAAKISDLSTRIASANHLQNLTVDNQVHWMTKHDEAQSKLTALTAEVERLNALLPLTLRPIPTDLTCPSCKKHLNAGEVSNYCGKLYCFECANFERKCDEECA